MYHSDSMQFFTDDSNDCRVNFYIERRLEEEKQLKLGKRKLSAPYLDEGENKYMTYDDSKFDIEEPNEDVRLNSKNKQNKNKM